MIERLTDWRTTLLGLALATLIIAALVTRPEWGAADLAAFAGAIGTALLGVLSRSSAPAPAAEKAPAVPPVVGALLLALALAGCTKAQVRSVVDAVRPGCKLVSVVSGSAVAGVVCDDVAAALSELLAAQRLGGAPCGSLVPVHDSTGATVGMACSTLAPALEARLAARARP